MSLTEAQLERYTRQIVLPGIGAEGQKKILNSKVIFMGAGGLSSAALLYLAASGVGNIGILDYDKVTLSNLHRQIIFNTEDIGTAKVLAAKERISKLNPEIKITIFEDRLNESNVYELIKDFDLVIDGLDNFSDKFLINDACIKSNKKLIHGGVIGYEGQILTVIPQHSACLRCYLPKPPEDTHQNCNELGVIASCVGVISSLVANEALKLILDCGNPYTNKILKYNALTGKFYEFNLGGRNKDCPLCGNIKSVC